MSVLIAVPVFRVGCKVGIDRGRAWSVIDEVILWAITRQSKTIASLATDADLPHQVVVASIARLMRFRLVEVTINNTSVAFRASEYGFKVVSSGTACGLVSDATYFIVLEELPDECFIHADNTEDAEADVEK